MTNHVDAVVIGATTRGLVAAYILDSLGYKTVLADRRPVAGGADASFVAADGSIFEFGMHVLDDMRSPVATRLFRHVIGDHVCRTELKRGIVLRGHVMPYAPLPSQMPGELSSLLAADELIDELGNAAPTRAALTDIYGAGFAELIFDEVLPSFPSEARHREFGVEDASLLTNIYPWFFPRAQLAAKPGDASRAFHDLLRQGQPQHILYPAEGGFGAFSQAFLDHYDEQQTRVVLGAKKLDFTLEPESQSIVSLHLDEETIQAKHYFWADSWPALCALIDLPCQSVATDRIVLGSFCFDHHIESEFSELLVGDPRLHINRLYFPADFTCRSEPRLQIEFAFPTAEEQSRSLDSDVWRNRWLDDMRQLGLITDAHRVTMFDFKTRQLHFNSFGMEGEPLVEADASLIDSRSNIRPLAPSMANWNLNTHVPQTIATVVDALCR